MSVFHCPVCPLIFEFRNEVEHHLRNEHRSRRDEQAKLTAETAAAASEIDWPLLRSLQAARRGVAVTLLLATTPAPVMTSLDVTRLRRLANQARRRVAAEPAVAAPTLEERLASVVAAAEGLPTQEGLAVLVNSERMAIFPLPFEPADRAVVDPRFATRDLETTLRCHPTYRLLVLARQPRLFEGRGLHLSEMRSKRTSRTPPPGERPGAAGWQTVRAAGGWTPGRAHRAAGVQIADDLLAGVVQAGGELPLVVVGDGRWRSAFRRSRHADTVVAEVPGCRPRESPEALARLAQPHLVARLRNEQAAATSDLERAEAVGAVVWGLEAAWAAVHEGTAENLWVEQGYGRPGRPTDEGAAVKLASDAEQPGVIDDLVDDLIEAAIAKRIGVHHLANGAIGRADPIAVQLRAAGRTTRLASEVAQAV